MILNTQDHNTLQKILGKLDIPEAVEQEYAIRAQMYHTEGSGPLGIAMLIDLVRSLGYKPPKVKPPGEDVDWRQYPQDGRTKIEAMFFGSWMPGVFLGFSENGMLMLRMDHDEYVKEVRKDLARIVSVMSEEQIAQTREKPDVRGHLIELEQESIELGRKAAEAARQLERAKKKADRAAERNNGEVDPVLQEQIAELTNQVAELESKARKPQPIRLSAPAPKPPGQKDAEPAEVFESVPADPTEYDIVADEEPAEVEYKQYVPTGPTSFEDVEKLERDTPLFVNPANPGDDVLEAVFVRITEDNLVQVLVDGEDTPRIVAPADITLVT